MSDAWVARDEPRLDGEVVARAAHLQATLGDALGRLRAVRFPLVPAMVEPATGDAAFRRAAEGGS